MNYDILFEIGDLAILIALWLALGGELGIIAYGFYMAAGLALDYLSNSKKMVDKGTMV